MTNILQTMNFRVPYLQEDVKTHRIIIVSGHASGADSMGERYAQEHGLRCEQHSSDAIRHGNSDEGDRRCTFLPNILLVQFGLIL